MAEIASWNGHQFVVSPTLIQSFTDLTIKGSSETEDKEGGGQKYASRKNSRPSEISFTVVLNALLGSDVQTEALKYVDDAKNGAQGYFYMGEKKLIACQMMLAEASISDVKITPSGKWVSCKVRLTMKQSSVYDGTVVSSSGSSRGGSSGGGSSGSSGGSSKASVNRSSTSSTLAQSVKNAVSSANSSSKSSTSSASSIVKAVSNAAKAVSSAVKAASSASKSSSSSTKVTSGTKSITVKKK